MEIGVLVDLWHRFGLSALAQVDLGQRHHHHHQSTAALGRMSYEIAQAVLDRLVAEGRAPVELTGARPYARPIRRDGGFTLETARRELVRRPPLCTIA